MTERPDHCIVAAAKAVRSAEALLVMSGAGMGVDGGLGTFQGAAAGRWPPLLALQRSYQELSCPAVFEEDPGLAWAFAQDLRRALG